MSRSLSSLTKRRKTIKTTQKITNAMKLVSMSKLQVYKRKMLRYKPIYEHVLRIPKEEMICTKPKVYIGFVPDLGLVSAYPRTLINTLKRLDHPKVFIAGHQSYDKFSSGEFCDLINRRMSSENLDLDIIQSFIKDYADDYQIICLMPEVSISAKIEFNTLNTCYKLKKGYDQVFEPSYELANKAFQLVHIKTTIFNAYYESKISEYTMRRVAMEQATENADSMLHDLQLQYNRLRQEKITEEIADLTEAED